MNMKKVSSKILALVMACAMLFSIAAPALAAGVHEHEDEGKVIHYVSLGDSMSNGYGLPGYEHNSGVETYGDASYANQFAAWLEENVADAVNHAQLSMSGIRVEDLHWLLELDYNDAEAIAVIEELIEREDEWANGSKECEALWNSVFSTGDFWTLSEICNHSRTDATYYLIAGTAEAADGKYDGKVHAGKLPTDFEYPTTYDADANLKYGNNRAMKIALIAKYFQDNVTDADIISLGVGNGNLGVFGFGRILDVIGFDDGYVVDTAIYNVESAIRELDAATQEKILGFKAMLMAKVAEVMPEGYGDNEMLSKLADVAVYIGLSMVLNYMGTYDAIVAMNPDVELVQVAIMNTFADEGEAGGVSIGKLMDVVVTPVNAFLAAYPTFMQMSGNENYANAKFYYAEADLVECMVNIYGDDFYNEDGTPNPNSIIRDRFVESIVGEGGTGVVWGLLKDVEFAGNKLVSVTFEEIMAYEVMTDDEKLAYAIAETEKAISISVYLAVENAIVSSAEAPVSLDVILGLGNIGGSLFEGVMDSVATNLEIGIANEYMRACAFVAGVVNATLTNTVYEMLGVELEFEVTAKNIYDIVNKDDAAGVNGANDIAAAATDVIVNAMMPAYKNGVYATIEAGALEFFAGLTAQVNAQVSAIAPGLAFSFTAEEYANGLDLVDVFYADCAADTFGSVRLAEYITAVLGAYADTPVAGDGTTLYQMVYAGAAQTMAENKGSVVAAYPALKNDDYLYEATLAMINAELGSDITAMIAGMVETEVLANADMINLAATLFALPEALSSSLKSDATVSGLLCLMSRCMIGNGLGAHPSDAGHDALAAAVISAYKNDYTAKDETVKNLGILADLIVEYCDEAYEVAYGKALEAGVIDMINAYLDEAVNSVNLAKAWVAQYPEYIKSAEFATALSNTFANAEATIEEARDLINNADKIDAETFAKASELLAALTTNVNDLNALVAIAIVDATPYVYELEAQAQAQIDALKAQAQLQIDTLKAQAEYQLLVLREQLKTAVGEAKAAILAEIARVDAELAAAIARVEAELAAAIEAAKADLAAAIADAEAKFNAAVAALKAAIVALKGNVTATANEIAAIIAEVDAKIGGLIKAVYAFVNGGYTETDTYKMIAEIIVAIRKYIAGIVTGEIELTEDTFYLAIVDGNDGYADVIAQALNLGADQYKKVTMDTVTAADIARADLITVAYSGASAIDYAVAQAIGFAGEYVDGALRTSLNTYLASAFAGILKPEAIANVSAVLNGAIDEVVATYLAGGVDTLDWAGLVGEDNLTYVEKAEGMINDALVSAGTPDVFTYTVDVVELLYANAEMLGLASYVEMFEASFFYEQLGENAYYTVEIPVMDVLTVAANSALYEYVSYNLNYYKTMLTINAVNPDAAVAALGNYNRFDVDYDFVIDEVAFTLADVLAELGYTDVAMPTEIITALDAIASVESVTIFTNVVEMTNIALGEYNKAVDYVVTLELPVCDEAKAMVADLITAANTYVGAFAGKVVEAEYITVTIPGKDIAALIVNQGKLIDAMIDASINTVITVGGQTVNANDVLDLIASITSMYPFAFALEFANVFYVDIADAKVLGDAYVAAKVLGALTVKCDHTYTDCEDAICNICGGERVPVGHSFTNYASNNDATCTENGTKTATCDNGCGATDTVVDANTATGHAYDNGVVTTAPTCEGAGVKTFTCANCGDTYTEAVSATGHTVVTDAAVAPTCTETGLTAGSHCSVCDAVIEAQTVVPALGHAYNNGVVTTAPTCEGAGVKTFTCQNCGDSYTEALSATGHTEVTVPGKAATCTETGLTDGKKCSVCNAVIVAQTTIAKKAHTEVTVPGKAATCTETGLTDGKKCSVCNTVTVAQTTIAKKAHTEVTDAAVAPTCTDTGLTEGKHCSVCNTVIVAQETVAALGHTYDDGVVTTAPTYTAEGVKTYTCSVCGNTYTEAIAMLEKADEIVSSGNSSIKVNVPEGSTAILDANTVIKVEAVTGEISKDVKKSIKNAIGKGKTQVLASYDISLLLDGASVQPGGMVAFTLPAPEDTDYDSFVVVFIDDDGNVTPCETTVNADGSVTFITDHFSQYSIIGVNNTSYAWIWITAIAVVLAAGAVVAFIVIKKKKENA